MVIVWQQLLVHASTSHANLACVFPPFARKVVVVMHNGSYNMLFCVAHFLSRFTVLRVVLPQVWIGFPVWTFHNSIDFLTALHACFLLNCYAILCVPKTTNMTFPAVQTTGYSCWPQEQVWPEWDSSSEWGSAAKQLQVHLRLCGAGGSMCILLDPQWCCSNIWIIDVRIPHHVLSMRS